MTATVQWSSTETLGIEKELIISADSHVMEVPDLWTSRLPEAFRERAPRPPALQAGDGIHRHAGGWDPTQRLSEMSVDGVSAEVLYTTPACRSSASRSRHSRRRASPPSTTG